MTTTYQVTDAHAASDVRTALNALAGAITDGWAITRRQINEEDYDERITQTGFGQFLHHNVMSGVYRLNGKYPGLATDLVPNDRRTAHHVTATVSDLFITMSSVSSVESRPRHAQFRTHYAQSYFTIDYDDNLQLTPPVDPGDRTYMQILHGPKDDNRHELGFVLVVFPTLVGQYRQAPMPIGDFLTKALPTLDSDVEQIEDTLYPGLIDDQRGQHAVQ